jgi:hypothetical protein
MSPTGTLPALRCDRHAIDGDVELFTQPCKGCGFDELLMTSGICTSCAVPSHVHLKEQIVHDFVRFKDSEQETKQDKRWSLISHDRSIDTSCTRRRPDFVLDFKSFFVVLEVDENQHKSYPCRCEHSRMLEVFQSLNGAPVLFIRYNPDSFKDDEGRRRKVPAKQRLKLLGCLLDHLSSLDSLPSISCITYMFYDGCMGTHWDAVKSIDLLQ